MSPEGIAVDAFNPFSSFGNTVALFLDASHPRDDWSATMLRLPPTKLSEQPEQIPVVLGITRKHPKFQEHATLLARSGARVPDKIYIKYYAGKRRDQFTVVREDDKETRSMRPVVMSTPMMFLPKEATQTPLEQFCREKPGHVRNSQVEVNGLVQSAVSFRYKFTFEDSPLHHQQYEKYLKKDTDISLWLTSACASAYLEGYFEPDLTRRIIRDTDYGKELSRFVDDCTPSAHTVPNAFNEAQNRRREYIDQCLAVLSEMPKIEVRYRPFTQVRSPYTASRWATGVAKSMPFVNQGKASAPASSIYTAESVLALCAAKGVEYNPLPCAVLKKAGHFLVPTRVPEDAILRERPSKDAPIPIPFSARVRYALNNNQQHDHHVTRVMACITAVATQRVERVPVSTYVQKQGPVLEATKKASEKREEERTKRMARPMLEEPLDDMQDMVLATPQPKTKQELKSMRDQLDDMDPSADTRNKTIQRAPTLRQLAEKRSGTSSSVSLSSFDPFDEKQDTKTPRKKGFTILLDQERCSSPTDLLQ